MENPEGGLGGQWKGGRERRERVTMYKTSKPISNAIRADIPSYTPGATTILVLSANISRRRAAALRGPPETAILRHSTAKLFLRIVICPRSKERLKNKQLKGENRRTRKMFCFVV